MWKSILAFFGIREARRRGLNPAIAPVGGLLPMIAWFAWRNRRQIADAYRTHVAPRLGSGMARASHA